MIVQGRRHLVFDDRRPNLLDGNRQAQGPGSTHDPRFQAVVEQARKAEILQVIDLFRLVHTTKRKTVYTRCGIPTDEPVEGPPSG